MDGLIEWFIDKSIIEQLLRKFHLYNGMLGFHQTNKRHIIYKQVSPAVCLQASIISATLQLFFNL